MIPEDKVLSPMEGKDHREAISSLLEKAMSKVEWGSSKSSKSSSKTSLGKCERTTWGTCGKDLNVVQTRTILVVASVCDTEGINECKCFKRDDDRLSEKKALAKVDTGSVLDNEKSIEKALDVQGVLFSVLFDLLMDS